MSTLQVLDVVVNKPFKDYLWQLYNDWFLRGNQAHTLSGKLKKPSISVLGKWILTAWERISSESTVTGFKKGCISNAIGSTEDNFLWQRERKSICNFIMFYNI
jgi:hypothetical protein